MLETAVSLPLFLALVLGTVDLGYGIFRHHVLAQSARQIARAAIVRGALADRLGSWGPEEMSLVASDSGEVPQMIAPSLIGWDLAQVEIRLEWIGGNDARDEHQVRVQLSAPYRPIMTFLLGNVPITLTASSTMRIAH